MSSQILNIKHKQSLIYNYKEINLEIQETHKHMEINIFLSTQWDRKEITRNIIKFSEMTKTWKYNIATCRYSIKVILREKFGEK